MKHSFTKKNLFSLICLTLALAIAATSALTLSLSASAEEPETVIVTSPFTAAVQKVHSSVVGVNNYVTYSRNNYGYGNNYGFGGYGYGYGYGNGYGNDNSSNSREVLYGSGSGVVIAENYVLTNYHVVEGASSLEVATDDAVFPAVLKGSDESLDIAILYVENLGLEPVTLGDSDALQIGDWAICIGNPLSFDGTTTVGIVSGLNREITGNTTDAYGKKTTNTMIHTDAAINSGNSGGGMFNVAGELVGIPSMKYSSSSSSSASVEGIGMAIPINVCKDLIENVLNGTVDESVSSQSSANSGNNSITNSGRPRIGVTVSGLNTSSYAVANGLIPNGAYVTAVEAGSPAETAGIQVGDIIVEVDGTIITSTTQMVSILQSKQAGETVSVKLYRVEGGLNNVESSYDIPDGDYMDLTVSLAMLDDVQQ